VRATGFTRAEARERDSHEWVVPSVWVVRGGWGAFGGGERLGGASRSDALLKKHLDGFARERFFRFVDFGERILMAAWGWLGFVGASEVGLGPSNPRGVCFRPVSAGSEGRKRGC